MRVIISFFFIALLQTNVSAQNGGVKYESGLSWKQLVKKAAIEHKNIMVDCYASWCQPCKFMEQHILTLPEVAEEINKKFLTIRVQMDSTIKDGAEIGWYAKARIFEKKYNVVAYPTFLFFNMAGGPLHKIIGASADGKDFLLAVRDVDSVNKQYYTLVNHYKEHLTDSAFLVNALLAFLKTEDMTNAYAICDVYFKQRKGNFNRFDWQLAILSSPPSTSNVFRNLMEQPENVDTAFGIGVADDFLIAVIQREEVLPLTKEGMPPIDWDALYSKLTLKYPRQAEDVILRSKYAYYAKRQSWDEYGKALVEFFNKYGFAMDAIKHNEVAWSIFVHCDDRALLREALNWSRQSIGQLNAHSESNFIDTYANLLYKLQRTNEAIAWEWKAASLAMSQNKKETAENFMKTIQRMKNGEKIWNPAL